MNSQSKQRVLKLSKDALAVIGPIMAGFQVATSIVGFFSLGAFARWVLDVYLPFTRYVWGIILPYLYLPDITDLEKDALTTVVFFSSD